MLFVMDVGNTQMVLGTFDGSALRHQWRLTTGNRTGDELAVLLAMLLQGAGTPAAQITGCCISSVVPQHNRALLQVSQDLFHIEPVMVGPGVKTGLVLQIPNPKEVGADRIANAVGALDEYGGPLIVVDFGTATTFDVVTEKGEWRGGVIVPGVQLAADALFERCAQLPRVEILRPPSVIGKDTVNNIRSGLTYGYADLVDGLIRRLLSEAGDPSTVVATGGLANIIADIATGIDVVDPHLTLKGLRAVYEKNAAPKSSRPVGEK